MSSSSPDVRVKTWGMVFQGVGKPLSWEPLEIPGPRAGEVLLRVRACGVCRTDLHVVDGELAHPKLPLVPGHEIVGEVAALGEGTEGFSLGERVGVPWLGCTCGVCPYCEGGQENLCDHPLFTGYTKDGGYALHAVANARYCFPLPSRFSDVEAAPLLCAGLIGFRSYRFAPGKKLGIYGFGAAAHILAQVAKAEGKEIFAFTRRGDEKSQAFALELGAAWAGASDEPPPEPLDSAILFAPVGELVPLALRAVKKGGVVVAGGIHMSDIPAFPYKILWEERVLRSVANLTRQDGIEFFERVRDIPLRTHVTPFPLQEANEALLALRQGGLVGAAVLVP